jgi:hypothetical protein
MACRNGAPRPSPAAAPRLRAPYATAGDPRPSSAARLGCSRHSRYDDQRRGYHTPLGRSQIARGRDLTTGSRGAISAHAPIVNQQRIALSAPMNATSWGWSAAGAGATASGSGRASRGPARTTAPARATCRGSAAAVARVCRPAPRDTVCDRTPTGSARNATLHDTVPFVFSRSMTARWARAVDGQTWRGGHRPASRGRRVAPQRPASSAPAACGTVAAVPAERVVMASSAYTREIGTRVGKSSHRARRPGRAASGTRCRGASGPAAAPLSVRRGGP